MKNIIYIDIASKVSHVRPAERTVFFDILPNRGYKVYSLLNGAKDTSIRNKNINQINCDSDNLWGFYKNLFFQMKALLLLEKIDFVIVRNNQFIGLVVLLSLLKNKSIIKIFIRAFPSELLRLHNAKEHPRLRKYLSIIKNNILILFSDLVMKRFDLIFGRSRAFANYLSNRLNRKIHCFPMGFDESWSLDNKLLANYKLNYNSKNEYLIGYFGSIDKGRNINFIIEVFKKIITTSKNPIKALIISNCTEKESKDINTIIKKSNLSDYIKLIGPISYKDMPNIIMNLRLTISPIPPIAPYLISSPTKTVESIGLGIPVIGNKEIADQNYVIESSGCGISVNYDVDEFVKASKIILNNYNTDMQKKGIKYIKTNRSYSKIADQLEIIINNFHK